MAEEEKAESDACEDGEKDGQVEGHDHQHEEIITTKVEKGEAAPQKVVVERKVSEDEKGLICIFFAAQTNLHLLSKHLEKYRHKAREEREKREAQEKKSLLRPVFRVFVSLFFAFRSRPGRKEKSHVVVRGEAEEHRKRKAVLLIQLESRHGA